MYYMDKDVQDAFKLLGNQITEGFVSVRQDMATKQDVDSIRQDVDSIRQDMATKQDVKKIIREEVQDIRKDIEARCSPSQTE